jgi:D-arabinose 1-dehydrogenase-like Zn-dependent alcohol dehydrogenase
VTAIGGQIDKKQMSLDLGANEYLLLDDAVATKKGTYDILINTASGKVDFTQLIGLLAPDGALVQVGLPGGNAAINLPLTVRPTAYISSVKSRTILLLLLFDWPCTVLPPLGHCS